MSYCLLWKGRISPFVQKLGSRASPISSLLRIGVTEESIATFHGTLNSLNPKCELITVEQCFLPTPEAATAFGKLNDRLSRLSLESTHVNPAKSISIKSADQAVYDAIKKVANVKADEWFTTGSLPDSLMEGRKDEKHRHTSHISIRLSLIAAMKEIKSGEKSVEQAVLDNFPQSRFTFG